MEQRKRIEIDPAFSFQVPPGWVAERDEEEGVLVSAPDGVGLLHLVAFPGSPDDMADPAEELYAFLDEHGIEILEDEVEDLELPEGGDMSLCEYLAEDEEEADESTYWLVAVTVAPGSLVFASYSCPAGEQEVERAAVREVLTSLRIQQGT
jgi:hypothetical protein